jgi:hypothetical protein
MLARARRSRAVLAFCFTLLLVAANGAVPQKDARASVSIAVLFEALVGDTTTACIATPTEQHAVWEGGRIVTYTRVHIDDGIAGELGTGRETWVVTLGGIVGDVGQIVEGEATLRVGLPSLLFLRPDPSAAGGGAHIVTARAQGQFHVRVDPKTRLQTFQTSPAMGVLYPPPPSMLTRVRSRTLASDVIANRPVGDVSKDVASAWSRTHAK